MKNQTKIFLMILLICVSGVMTIRSQDKKVTYQNVEVTKFEIKPETKFPEASLDVMMVEIVDELVKTKKFSTVKNVSEEKVAVTAKTDGSPEVQTLTETIPDASVLHITGVITEYKEGNRAARYLVGFGAGRAKIKAHIKVTDSAGKILLEKDVDGNLVIGLFGGNSNVITRGLAKEIAKDVKKKFFK